MKLSIWDILTIVVVAITAILLLVMLVIFINPNSSINPFPQPTLPALVVLPSPTATLYMLPATWTPTPLVEATRMPSSTPIPTMTPLVLPPGN